ncbi:S-layer homology domain-containing protein [Nitriliruptoraceae bacterium ZYF776]|nr:S-layer homology domain-containing protein [Profundirhabdus halotolerans]
MLPNVPAAPERPGRTRSPLVRRTAIPAVLLVVASALAVAAPATADERVCRGSIGASTVDDLRVPDGAACTLDGTRVEGNVVVGSDARLVARDVRVDGNIQAENHRSVDVRDSRVGGSVQIEQGGGAVVYRTTIDSDLQYSANRQRVVAHTNTVGGNVQVMSHRGGVDVSANRIDGNLQCTSNDPSPTGGANVVRGSAEDQCARLTGGSASPAPGSGGSSGGSRTFCDTAGSPHEANIEKVARAGIALGNGGCFKPNDPVTRGQMATFLQRAYDLRDGSRGFCDTAGHPHERGIRATAAAGIALGNDGCFQPDAAVRRGQMASFLTRAADLPSARSSGFCDTRGHTHETSIDRVAAAGIAQGSGGCYQPDAAVTRGQMATFLARALRL